MNRIEYSAAMLALALAGCSGGDGEANKATEQAATELQPGEYEITSKVESLRSTDKTTPATKLKEGSEPTVVRACVAAGNAIDVAAFAEAGDNCTVGESYMRNGRMNLQLRCSRKGHGDLASRVDGKFKGDSFTGDVTTTTYFSGTGDYELSRSVEGKRAGDCPAKAG